MPDRVPNHRSGELLKGRRRRYDDSSRDPRAARFYRSSAWLRLRKLKLATDPMCQRCLKLERITPATTVHHVIELSWSMDHALDIDNLESLCASCHSLHHKSVE